MTTSPGRRPSPRTWSSNSKAIWPLVRSRRYSSGTPACSSRSGEPVQDLGRNSRKRRGEMPLGTDVVDRDGDLAVGLLAQLAAVLMLHADGVLALLGEAGIVDDEDPLGAGEGLGHHGAVAWQDLLFVPGALVDELLQGLFGVFDVEQFRRPGDAGGHRFDALALAVLEQAAEVDAAPGALGLVAEVVVEQLGIVAKPFEDFGGSSGVKVLFILFIRTKPPRGS